jgi:uncharacterized protein YdaU (DUF1376 family)
MAPINGERARFAWFPLYVDDWLASDAVDAFTLEQQGAYLRLLLRQFTAADGTLPRDARELARISKLGDRWRKVGAPIIARCFVEHGEGLVNLRCRAEWERARDKSAKAAKAGRKRWKQERAQSGR